MELLLHGLGGFGIGVGLGAIAAILKRSFGCVDDIL